MSISARSFRAALSDANSRASRRIVIRDELLKAFKITAGDVLAVINAESAEEKKHFAIGIAWPSIELPQDSILLSSSLLLTAHLEEGHKVQLVSLSSYKLPEYLPTLGQSKEARFIRVKECMPRGHRDSSAVDEKKGKRRDWLPLLIREALVDVKYLSPTQIVEVTFERHIRRFQVLAISSHDVDPSREDEVLAKEIQNLSLQSSSTLWVTGWDTYVHVVADPQDRYAEQQSGALQSMQRSPDDGYSTVGGLDRQIAMVRDLIEIPLTRPELFLHFGLKPPRGILLHGPPGTGKTHLARAIAASMNSSVIIINGPELSSAYHGETESKIRDIFSDARSKSPCIVVLDEVDALCPRREEGPGGEVEKRVVAQLLTIMDGMEDESQHGGKDRVVVVATTNRPNAIDPALRRPGRFDREIEIGVPDATARYSILKILLSKAPHIISDEALRSIASNAHGYVGADLSAVVREAGTSAIKRWIANNSQEKSSRQPEITPGDLSSALLSVRPSAMRSVFLDTVPVRYTDIGGQKETIQKLRECVEWPLLHSDTFARLGAKAPKGVLLYGPPGCSKTLLVRACATESGVNFVAVKGPELLNKYLGESERSVREIFRKARAAAPSIIFFDEIDALATSRSASDGAGVHEGVLTSLLNEMDGVEELVGVTVVAATNRPDVIDSALMRPGRLDRIIYVGPPDELARREILQIRVSKMSVEPGLNIVELAKITEGCSGAELIALCQEAAIQTMKENLNAQYIPHTAFFAAAKATRKQITPDVVANFEKWALEHGVTPA